MAKRLLFFGAFALFSGMLIAQADTISTTTIPKKMTVEIWSDVMCPFCYIGKRRFEEALAQYPNRDSVTVVWRSFQLDPSLVTDPSKTVAQSLAEKKGWSAEETTQMIDYVTNMAKGSGLTYHFEKAVVANSYDAHRFTHYAKSKGKQLEAEEALFAAYFTHGKNTANHEVLADLGQSIGLDRDDLLRTLASDAFRAEVEADLELARGFGINSVPFFVFDRKSAVSGAQESSVFLKALLNN